MTSILSNSILITGIVICMMSMIELVNEKTKGRFFERFSGNGLRQIIFATLLGCIPGCIGGFATVSLYSRRMISIGALTAMMIASSGDEAFVMLAMFPGKAVLLMAVLAVIAIICGAAIDKALPEGIGKTGRTGIAGYNGDQKTCDKIPDGREGTKNGENLHKDEGNPHNDTAAGHAGRYGLKRAGLAVGFMLFIAALISGGIGHSHGNDEGIRLTLLDETWMNALFGILALSLVAASIFGSRKIVELEMHIVKRHALPIFLWTAGALALVHLTMQHIDIADWIGNNIPLMILLASLIGIIPESGPNLIFVTLFASGSIPFSVLLANSISQDGHSSIPLLAENKKSFAVTKLLNTAIALVCGYAAMFIERLV